MTTNPVHRVLGVRAALAVGLFLALAGFAAAQETEVSFNIPAQAADAALREFARQSGRQILFPFAQTVGRSTPAVRGRYTPTAAVTLLAAAVGLRLVASDDRTMTLVADEDARGNQPVQPEAAVAQQSSTDIVPSRIAGIRSIPVRLQEVIVTATRRADTLNRVPISITAQTRELLEQQRVQQIRDLVSVVPALALNQLSPATANIIVRGVTDGGAGAATTGFYVDDSPLAKRNAEGVRSGTGNGTPLPPIFDLERIEVLRGPQGTLFGSGSVGGTVRYINPQPSLDAYTALFSTEIASNEYGGDPSYEAGLAVGGPLRENRLGFRVAAWGRNTGGYLDFVNPYSGEVQHGDANGGQSRMFRGSLLWAVTDSVRATFTYLASVEDWDSTANSYTLPITDPIVEPTLCFNTTGITPADPRPHPPPVDCSSPGVTHVRQGETYGPYPDLDPGLTLAQAPTPWRTELHLPMLTVDVDLPGAAFKSITSYVDDSTGLLGVETLTETRGRFANATYGSIFIPRGLRFSAISPEIEDDNGRFLAFNDRHGYAQEFRLASTSGEARVRWLAGLYYSHLENTALYDVVNNDLERISQYLYGLTAEQRYGVPGYVMPDGQIGTDHKLQHLDETEFAAFGEASYWPNSRWGLTLGLRYSYVDFDYDELHYGAANGFLLPTVQNGGGLNEGSATESQLAPKFGLQYQITPAQMVYASIARGFRAGGVNVSIAENICSVGLDQYGLDQGDIPPTYEGDSVWSYELGGKFRFLDERIQLNGAVFRIDRNDVQLPVNIGNSCGFPFTVNAGKIESTGFELELQARLFGQLTLNAAVGYTDAEFPNDVVALAGKTTVPLVVARAGQKIAVPPWTLNAGAGYTFELGGLPVLARIDWSYAAALKDTQAQIFGVPGYSPDNRYPATQRTNLNFGIESGRFAASVFVTNLFNEQKGAVIGGRIACALPEAGGTAACTSYGLYIPNFNVTPAYAPRQVGVQFTWRY